MASEEMLKKFDREMKRQALAWCKRTNALPENKDKRAIVTASGAIKFVVLRK